MIMSGDDFLNDCIKTELDLTSDIFMTGGMMDPKDLYMTELVCSKDASSSDSGVSAMDDLHDSLQDIADVSELNQFMDSELKGLDFTWEFPFTGQTEDPVFDSGILVKQEPSSPSSTLSSETSSDDFFLQQPVCANVKNEEESGLLLPAHDSFLASYSPQQSYNVEPSFVPSNITTIQQSPALFNPPVSYTTSCLTSQPNTPLPSTQVSNGTSPGYIVVPNIKAETLSPKAGGRQGVTVNINAIINSKVKIQPKPGTEVPSPTGSSYDCFSGTSQWVATTPTTGPTLTSPTSPVTLTPALISSIPSITDEKSLKRAQRIIKNRESASLSRKRKKEYVSSLEEKVQQYQEENNRLAQENDQLKKMVDSLRHEYLQLSQASGLSPAKKICLMCFVLLLTLNLAPYSLLSNTNTHDAMRGRMGRQLLSVSEDKSDSSRSEDLIWSELTDRGLLFQFDKELGQLAEKMNRTQRLGTMCPMYFNSTESIRLAEQLRGWMISQEEEKKKKKDKKERKKANKAEGVGLKVLGRRSNRNWSMEARADGNYAVQVFTKPWDQPNTILNAIPRRNDTFYVLSFSTDYYLMPATAHNKTQRPRMSLLMPVVTTGLDDSGSGGDRIGMMQIDCEILNTNMIHVQKNAFPREANLTRFEETRESSGEQKNSWTDGTKKWNSTHRKSDSPPPGNSTNYWKTFTHTKR